ncbi:hypothetical protein Hanom_Chr10g00966591 [Helianthus anomalus]
MLFFVTTNSINGGSCPLNLPGPKDTGTKISTTAEKLARAEHSIYTKFQSKCGKLALRPKNLPGPWPCHGSTKIRP